MARERAWRSRLLDSKSDPLAQVLVEVDAAAYLPAEARRSLRRDVRHYDDLLQDRHARKKASWAVRHELLLLHPDTSHEARLSGTPRLYGELRDLGVVAGRSKGATVPAGTGREVTRRAMPMREPGPHLGRHHDVNDDDDYEADNDAA